MSYTPGQLKIEGKTKQVYETLEGSSHVIIHSKDDLTAGDGKRHDVIPGKGIVSNTTSCNVFSMLKSVGIPVAFVEQLSASEMLAESCDMLPLELVARRLAQGSILERQPSLKELHRFDPVVTELFLKTSRKKWKGTDLPVDDPFMWVFRENVTLHLPDEPFRIQNAFRTLLLSDIIGDRDPGFLDLILSLLKKTFLTLEEAYMAAGNFELVDMKIECGLTKDGRLVVADVIDAESIRLRRDGKNYDKQPYRDGGLNPEIMERFQEVLMASGKFPH